MKVINRKAIAYAVGALLCLANYYVYSGPGEQIAIPRGATDAIFGYYEFLPENYQNSTNEGFPLLIFFHGLGEKGDGKTELSRVLLNGPPKEIDANRWPSERPFVVISPQHWSGWWSNNYTEEFINYLLKTYNIDENRIYLTGLSSGATHIWNYISVHSSQIAAAIPIAGRGTKAWEDYGCKLGNTPIWAFHGDADNTLNYMFSVGPCNNINSCNPLKFKAKCTIYPNVGHDAWTKTYSLNGLNTYTRPEYDPFDQNIYDWLLKYRTISSNPNNDKPVANAGDDQTIKLPLDSAILSGTMSQDYNGNIDSYSWNQVSGPSSALITNPKNDVTYAKNLVSGIYEFSLTVVDDMGLKSSDNTIISVLKGFNSPPEIELGNDFYLFSKQDTLLIAESSDNEGDVLRYNWEQINGPVQINLTSEHSDSLELIDLIDGLYTFKVTTYDAEGQSASDFVNIIVTPDGENGLNYRYYEGVWNELPDFKGLDPASYGVAKKIGFASAMKNDYFGIDFRSYIYVPIDNEYTFYLNSDDGSLLYLDDSLIIDNDGLHPERELSCSVFLNKGLHRIKINYFERTGQQILQVFWKNKIFPKHLIPDLAFYINDIDSDTIPPTPPSNLKVIQGETTLILNWKPSFDEVSVNGYEIYLNNQLKKITLDNYAILDSLKEGHNYTIEIKAFDNEGNISEPLSNKTNTVLFHPDNLRARLKDQNYIEVSWQDNSNNETNFVLECSQTKEFSDCKSIELSKNSTYFLDSSVVSNNSYYYRVKCTRSSIIDSEFSNIDSVVVSYYNPKDTILNSVININITSKASGLEDWNDIILLNDKEIIYEDLIFNNSIRSSIDLILYNGFNGSSINNIVDNEQELNKGGILPDEVLRFAAFTSSIGKIVLKECDPNFNYNIKLIGGRAINNRKSEYVLNNCFYNQLDCSFNNKEFSVFENIVPIDSTITISFSGLTSIWGYLNAIIIERSFLRQEDARLSNRISSTFVNNLIYPIPVHRFINISSQQIDLSKTFRVNVFDLSGHLVFSSLSNSKSQFLVEDLNRGLYLLIVDQNNKEYKQKFYKN